MIVFESAKWEGIEGLADGLLAELRPRAEAVVERVAMFFVAEVHNTLRGARSGRAYELGERTVGGVWRDRGGNLSEVKFVVNRGKKSRIHIASAPGEPPAQLTGRLRQSIAWTPPKWDGHTVESEVGTNVEYARRLEFGGIDRRGVKIEARPYWAPTMLRIEAKVQQMFERAL